MISETQRTVDQGLVDSNIKLQALVAALEFRVSHLEESLELALRTVERFAEIPARMKVK